MMPRNVRTVFSSHYNIKELLPLCDVIIGSVLIPGGKCPKLVTREMLGLMKERAVVVDVAVDQGGCIETCHPTTHANPTFVVDGVVHYCVANMPGAVPYTSTIGLTNATVPFALSIADKGWKKAVQDDLTLKKGLNIINGKICYKGVSEAFNLPYYDVESLL
eukprot:GHVL01039213.1.p1 GENE.GHVL01039213.1~~GHVL01039213.1.p1  ORF type:complete len:162 (+),score=32.17 GHVL01039213.1:197-682(+)